MSHFLPLYTESLSLDFSGLPDELDPSILSRDTLTRRGVAQTRHAGCDRCRVRAYAAGGFAFNSTRSYPRTHTSIPQEETEFRSDGTNRVILPARLSDVFLSCEGTAQKKEFYSSTATSIEVMSSSIISPSSRASNVRSRFPLSAPLRRALGTAHSRRLGSALLKVHVDTAEACVHKATIARRSRMHIYRPRLSKDFWIISKFLAGLLCFKFILDHTTDIFVPVIDTIDL